VKSCHESGGQSPIMWAFSLGIVACHVKSCKIVGVDEVVHGVDEVVHSVARSWTGGFSRDESLDDEQSYMQYASCKMLRRWGVMVPEHLLSMPYTHVTSGRIWFWEVWLLLASHWLVPVGWMWRIAPCHVLPYVLVNLDLELHGQPDCLADRPVTGFCRSTLNPWAQTQKKKVLVEVVW